MDIIGARKAKQGPAEGGMKNGRVPLRALRTPTICILFVLFYFVSFSYLHISS